MVDPKQLVADVVRCALLDGSGKLCFDILFSFSEACFGHPSPGTSRSRRERGGFL